jgi:hypothetical protein
MSGQISGLFQAEQAKKIRALGADFVFEQYRRGGRLATLRAPIGSAQLSFATAAARSP